MHQRFRLLLVHAVRVTVVTSTILMWQPPPARPESAASSAGAVAPSGLQAMVEQRRDPFMRWPKLDDVSAELVSWYRTHGWRPLWFEAGLPSASAQALIRTLAGADDFGLDPADYDAGKLAALIRLRRATTGAELEQADLALSAAALRIVRTLCRGRVGSQQAHVTPEIQSEPFDALATADSLRGLTDLAPLMRTLQPPYEHYWRLVEAHRRYRRIALDSTLVALPAFPLPLKPGEPYRGAAVLRRLLTALDDVPDSARVPGKPDTLYDDDLVAAVRHFQRRQGYAVDGVIGPATAASLERPFERRLRQIELSLERWRWLPHSLIRPPIVVNLPGFELAALSSLTDTSTAILRMDVQVGKAFKHETPVFAEELKYLVFSPYWEVPTSIMRGEIRPKAQRDPKYLARNHYELLEGYSGDARVLRSTAENIARIGGAVRVRQTPGAWNSLGRVKFMLPNPYNIYLHDTPSQSNFAAAKRDFSHGCIRLSQPQALAEFVLRDRPEWTPTRIAEAMRATKPQQVNLLKPIPVYIAYTTVVARRDGAVHFYDDVYGHDRTLETLLRVGYPYPR